MSRLIVALALAAFSAALQAQEASFRFPFTYVLGGFRAIAVGPGGDIWGVGVSSRPGLPGNNPDGNPPPEGTCETGGYHDDIAHLFPYIGPCSDLVAMRLAGDGSGIIFSKYLGGPGVDSVSDIAVAADGTAYLTGSRAADPGSQPGTSSYLIALAPDGSELFDKELPVEFVPQSLALDAAGDIYIGGNSRFVLGQAETYWINGRVLRVSTATQEIVTTVELGGRGMDWISDIVVAQDGIAYVVGETQSFDFPFTEVYATPNPNPYHRQNRDFDVFVAALEPSAAWRWVASLGGSGEERFPRIALKDGGQLLVAATTESGDLPELNWPNPTPGGSLWTATLDRANGAWLRGGRLGYNASVDGLAADADGTIYLSGGTYSNQFAARLDAVGAIAAAAPVGGDRDRTLIAVREGRIVIDGSTYIAPLEFEAPGKRPQLAAILNAAGSLAAGLSPGAVLSLYGQNLGPAMPVPAVPANGRFPTEVAGVQVLIGGQAIPLLFVSRGQINAVLPFDLGSDPLVKAQVLRNGQLSNFFQMTTTATAPELFSVAVNADGSLNSPENPASRGLAVSVWVSGVGTFSPMREDGAIEGTTGPYPQIDAPVRVRLAGYDADVTYAGAAPGLVAGIAQINFVIPETVQDGRNLFVWVGEGSDPPAARGSIAVLP